MTETSKRRERRYGLTSERFAAVMADQGGFCAICRKRPPTDVDHCHGAGHFRGLLCRPCNLGIGMFADDPELMKSAIEYLGRPTMPISKQYPQRKRVTKPYPRGERCHSSKLNDQTVRSMREDYQSGNFSYAQLGGKYGLHPVSVGRVIRRVEWKHVP